jgi:16S rRNA (guanine527-N7)-methyltransferase
MDRAEVLAVLEESRELGLLGPGPAARQYSHARDLAAAIGSFGGEFLDLGSGGGVPGLVLAEQWPDARATLLDAQQRRCAFLEQAVDRLGLRGRVDVVCGRAERLAREPGLRAGFDLVVARSFAAPAVTAECAVGFLRASGRLVVTEPPTADDPEERWPVEGMAALGFGSPVLVRHGETGAMTAALLVEASDRWPRREGVPGKRPLWR